MDLEDVRLSEISQRKTNTVFHSCVESKKDKANEQAKQTQTQRETDSRWGLGEERMGEKGEEEQEVQTSRYK